jgi:nitroreductase
MNTVISKTYKDTAGCPPELLAMGAPGEPGRSLDARSLSQLFYNARSHSVWTDERVDHKLLRDLYDLMKWGPTAVNSSPLRVTFVESDEAKARLLAGVNPGNHEKVRTAPVTAILSYDTQFFEKLDTLAPHLPKPSRFESDEETTNLVATHNAWLQAGYFIIAARSLGLDCGPIGGFSQEKVMNEFFADGCQRPFMLVNLGYGKRESMRPRAARLDFEEACDIQ